VQRTKVGPAIAGKCDNALNSNVLAKFQPVCPSPANDPAVANFADVAVCEQDIGKKMIENLVKYIMHQMLPRSLRTRARRTSPSAPTAS
jgi:hypothetical protein